MDDIMEVGLDAAVIGNPGAEGLAGSAKNAATSVWQAWWSLAKAVPRFMPDVYGVLSVARERTAIVSRWPIVSRTVRGHRLGSLPDRRNHAH